MLPEAKFIEITSAGWKLWEVSWFADAEKKCYLVLMDNEGEILSVAVPGKKRSLMKHIRKKLEPALKYAIGRAG